MACSEHQNKLEDESGGNSVVNTVGIKDQLIAGWAVQRHLGGLAGKLDPHGCGGYAVAVASVAGNGNQGEQEQE